MTYDFWCECGEMRSLMGTFASPPAPPMCSCGGVMYRRFGAVLDTSGCRDHDFVPIESRVTQATARGVTAAQGRRKEAQYQRELAERRKLLKDGGNKGSIKMTHQIPAELYHGKIKQTGDQHYWKDDKNMARHRSCKVG